MDGAQYKAFQLQFDPRVTHSDIRYEAEARCRNFKAHLTSIMTDNELAAASHLARSLFGSPGENSTPCGAYGLGVLLQCTRSKRRQLDAVKLVRSQTAHSLWRPVWPNDVPHQPWGGCRKSRHAISAGLCQESDLKSAASVINLPLCGENVCWDLCGRCPCQLHG